ncbi:MAG: SPOR domain-containing protein [Rhodanobacteraceae bacterium]
MKTRLLGAAVLIALAIIFVPMLFSSSRKSSGEQSVSLNIPDQPDAQLKTKTLDVGPDSASANAGSSDPDHVATVNIDAATPALTTAPQNLNVAPSKPAPAASVVTVPAAKPAPAANTMPAPQVAKPAPPTAPAPPLPGGAGAAANGAFSLNLGVYANHGNADRLIARIGKMGYPAHGESTTYQGKPATRVSAGPFADRAAAEAARLKLKGAEPDVPISLAATATNQTKDAPSAAVPANRAGGWAVQLGAFGSESDANMLRDKLRALGFDGYVDDIPSGNGKLWRVRAGPVNDRGSAEQLRTQIAAKMKISGVVVTSM